LFSGAFAALPPGTGSTGQSEIGTAEYRLILPVEHPAILQAEHPAIYKAEYPGLCRVEYPAPGSELKLLSGELKCNRIFFSVF
jgi:hypothetical protein